MKTLLFPAPGIKQEISTTTHALHQDALNETARSIIKALGVSDAEWTVLYGCEEVEGSPDWEISAGAIYHNGEVYLCNGIEGNDGGNVPVLTVTETNIGQPAKFSDFIDRHVHKERKLMLSFAAANSADVNYSDLVRVDDKLKLHLNILGMINTAIEVKANKSQGAWQTIALNGAGYSVRNGMTPQYRVDQFGIVHLRGQIEIDADESFVANAGAVPGIPTGSTSLVGFIVASLESAVAGSVRVTIHSDGRISLPAGYPAAHIGDTFYLNGISYAQEAY